MVVKVRIDLEDIVLGNSGNTKEESGEMASH